MMAAPSDPHIDGFSPPHFGHQESGEAEKKPEKEKHQDRAPENGDPESVLFNVGKTDPDGDNPDEEKVGGHRTATGDHKPQGRVF